MYEFLLRSKGKILWEWYNLDKAESMAVAGMNALSKFEDKLQCLTLLTKISLARGNLDNTARLLGEVESLEHSHSYHHDWIANADQVRIFYWQMTNDVSAVRNWLIQNPHRFQIKIILPKCNGEILHGLESCLRNITRRKPF